MSSVEQTLQELSRRLAQNMPFCQYRARAWVPSTLRRARLRRTLANRFKEHDTEVHLDRIFTAAEALCSFDQVQTADNAGAYYELIVLRDVELSNKRRRL